MVLSGADQTCQVFPLTLMPHLRSLTDAKYKNSWLTIGVFDGVHRGHQEIIKRLTAGAHADGVPAVVLTFDPHPAVVLTNQQIKCITTADERADLLALYGVDAVITERFTPELSAVPAYEFMSRLKANLGLTHLLIGYDFALGKGREGNAPQLTEIGTELNYAVEVIPAMSDESGVISSTEIRKLLSLGDVANAHKLLGHPYSLHGEIIHGEGRGRKIKVPTANIDYDSSKLIPPNGIYACWAYLGNEKFRAAVSIGTNPTFTPEKKVQSVEAYLLDFDRDIYGQDLKLEFIARLRDEMKFPSVDALVDQIWRDVEQVMQIV